MQAFPTRIQRIISEGYNFQFGEYISRGFNIINNNSGSFIGFMLVWLVISFVTNIVGTFLIGITDIVEYIFISPCLMAGFYLACRRSEDGSPLIFENFFDGFKHWQPLMLAALIQIGIILVPLMLIGGLTYITLDINTLDQESILDNSFLIFGLFLLLLPLIYIGVAWQYAPLLIIFEKMSPWAALEASRKIISKHWFVYLGFGIIVSFLMLIGVIAIFIGLLYTIPAGLAMIYASYSDIVGFPDGNEEMDLLDHFIE